MPNTNSDNPRDITWHVTNHAREQIQVSEAELIQMARVGTLAPTDYLWREGFDDWHEAQTIPSLFQKRPAPRQKATRTDGRDTATPVRTDQGSDATPTRAPKAKWKIPEKLVEEFKEMLALTAYLFVIFGAMLLYKAAILHGQDVQYAPFGLAIIKAFVCAKFMLIGRMIKIGEGFEKHALIVPIFYRSMAFLGFLAVLTYLEEIIVGLYRGHSIYHSVSEVAGGTLAELGATCLVLTLSLMPYFAFRLLGELIGEHHLLRIFFTKGARQTTKIAVTSSSKEKT